MVSTSSTTSCSSSEARSPSSCSRGGRTFHRLSGSFSWAWPRAPAGWDGSTVARWQPWRRSGSFFSCSRSGSSCPSPSSFAWGAGCYSPERSSWAGRYSSWPFSPPRSAQPETKPCSMELWRRCHPPPSCSRPMRSAPSSRRPTAAWGFRSCSSRTWPSSHSCWRSPCSVGRRRTPVLRGETPPGASSSSPRSSSSVARWCRGSWNGSRRSGTVSSSRSRLAS